MFEAGGTVDVMVPTVRARGRADAVHFRDGSPDQFARPGTAETTQAGPLEQVG